MSGRSSENAQSADMELLAEKRNCSRILLDYMILGPSSHTVTKDISQESHI